jgi:hypothetical protein
MGILTAQGEKRNRYSSFCPSHPAATLIEFVAVDDRLDVSTRCGKIDLLKKLAFRYLGNGVSTAPALGTTGAGVVLRQSEWSWIGLMVPVRHGAMQIPRAGLQSCLWLEKLIGIETGDLVFARPLVGRSFGDLHQAALSMAALLFWIEPALTPDDGFHQHRIQMMF